MIVSVFVRRLKPGATFEDFVREWEADEGFGVPTRVFNAQSLTDPRDIISIRPPCGACMSCERNTTSHICPSRSALNRRRACSLR